MYKLIAVDLDGTLLNQYGEVTENSKRVIKNVTRKGMQVVIASGRSIDSIKNISKEIGASKYIIAGNGAVVYDIKEDKIIYENYIPFNKALNIINICEENSIFYNVYTNKTIVTSSLRYNVLYYYKENLKVGQVTVKHLKIIERLKLIVKENLTQLLDILKNVPNIQNAKNYLMICLYNNLGNTHLFAQNKKENTTSYNGRNYEDGSLDFLYANNNFDGTIPTS